MKKEQQIYISIGIGVVAFIFLYFNFLLNPVNRDISEKRRKIKETLEQVEQAKRESLQLEEFKVKSQILETEVKELQERLPKSKDIPDLIRRIAKDSEKFGIKISNFQPRPTMTGASSEYDEIPFGITYTASYHSLANFFAEIGQEKRLLATRDLSMNAQAGTDKKTTIGGTFTLIAYMAKGGR
ncbi:MAG: type 4a pilus biogenesis protein PilO [Elusimicrobia bacterium]|nr:type 4a pilus biogenesis protein PilO [Elusimicrobiota bacterium]MBU2614747.1 type 4a pilus biogenesis protein PilO [Elusimicrobiota bacterium]